MLNVFFHYNQLFFLFFLKGENNRLVSDELKLKNDQKEKLKHLEDELLASKTDLNKLKIEILERTSELNLEKAKLDASIKSELVNLREKFLVFIFFCLSTNSYTRLFVPACASISRV